MERDVSTSALKPVRPCYLETNIVTVVSVLLRRSWGLREVFDVLACVLHRAHEFSRAVGKPYVQPGREEKSRLEVCKGLT